MKQLTTADVLDIAQYEKQRESYRNRVMELKKHRRVQVGDLVTLVFENRETIKFQIQEIMRAERIVNDNRIQEEIDTYNELLPGSNELSATLLVEIQDKDRLREILDQFIGIDRGGTTFLEIGGERAEAEYEGGHGTEVRVSAVHYLRFRLTPQQAQRFADTSVPAKVIIEHPSYKQEAIIPDSVRASLIEDLREG
jgi:hypothetical protein